MIPLWNNSFKFEEVNALNLEKTKLYYNQIRSEIYAIVVETISLEAD